VNLCAFVHAGRRWEASPEKLLDTRQSFRKDEIPDLERFVQWQKTSPPVVSSFWCPLLACKSLCHSDMLFYLLHSHSVELGLQQDPRVINRYDKIKFS